MGRKLTYEQVQFIIAEHQKWLNSGGFKGRCADFTNAELIDMDLSHVYLNYALFAGAQLTRVIFDMSNLNYANMQAAAIRDCSFVASDMAHTNMSGTYIKNADFTKVIFIGVDFSSATISASNFQGAYVEDAIFRSAHFESNSNLLVPLACPSNGGFIGWKKALSDNGEPFIVKLYIPPEAKRSSAGGRKCRANIAEVIGIESFEGYSYNNVHVHSWYNEDFEYKVGDTLVVEDFDDDRFRECAPGIHFFIDRKEAVDYQF